MSNLNGHPSINVGEVIKLEAGSVKIRPLILLRKFDFSHKLGFWSPNLVNHFYLIEIQI